MYEGAEPPVLRYGVVNLYLTFLDDLFEVYLIGIQVDVERIGETRFPCSLDT